VQELEHPPTHLREIDAERAQHGGGRAFALPYESEQHVLGSDVVVPQVERLAEGELEAFLARGVNGGDPLVSPEGPIVSATFSRAASSVTPHDASVFEATPAPSPISPSSRCSVPMKLWFSRRASSCANTRTQRDRSVKRSNTQLVPCQATFAAFPAASPAARCVLVLESAGGCLRPAA
jgi:hypothetical protein